MSTVLEGDRTQTSGNAPCCLKRRAARIFLISGIVVASLISSNNFLKTASKSMDVFLDEQLMNSYPFSDSISPVLGTNDSSTRHHPDFFSKQVPFEAMIARMNVLTPHTGCSIATWVYTGELLPNYLMNDCTLECGTLIGQRDLHPYAIFQGKKLQPHDSIYVPTIQLPHFIKNALPNIKVEFVLISGQHQKLQPNDIPFNSIFETIISHTYVTHWFMQNLGKYGLDPYQSHPKVIPFPYGVAAYAKTRPSFQRFLNESIDVAKKDEFIHVGFFTVRNEERRGIPVGRREPMLKYLDHLRSSKYVLSPDGDRPECYRHYEAIALGAMPITQLDPNLHSHLAGNAIFNNTNWNLTELEAALPANPDVNRRLIFAEYWMEYVEGLVGRPMRWWDPTRNIRCSLAEITESVKNGNESLH